MEEQFFPVRNEGGPIKVNAAAVRRARYKAGLTQEKLARRMKLLGYFLPQSYVSRIENNGYPWGLSERMATALAAALGVGLTTITGGKLLSEAASEHAQDLLTQLMGEVASGVADSSQPAA